MRYYQEEAVQAIFDYFEKGGTGNPIVAMPTGTGKSIVIAEFIRRVLALWPRQRFMMLTHVKELIEQDVAELVGLWPSAPVGIYSAGLGYRDTCLPIIMGGIGSVVKAPYKFGLRDLGLIDECHLIDVKAETDYRKTINVFQEINPYFKVIGFTATPWRLGQGMLTEGDGRLFTDICYDITGKEAFNRLVREGYIAPLVPVPTETEIDVTGIRTDNKGEYRSKEVQDEINRARIIERAVNEMVRLASARRKWLIFNSSIEDALKTAAMLRDRGVSAVTITSKTKPDDRRRHFDDFKAGRVRALTNQDVATTGTNIKDIDMIACLRVTTSSSKWVQMLGRGTRTHPEKRDCLVLDFAGNAKRLGPINDPRIPRPKGKGTGDAPIKVCKACGTTTFASARECPGCGAPFDIKLALTQEPSTQELIRGDEPVYDVLNVVQVGYSRHIKVGSSPSLKITYFCSNGKSFSEWWSLEHAKPFVKKKSREAWRKRSPYEPPETVDEALMRTDELQIPLTITVHMNINFPSVVGFTFPATHTEYMQ